MSDYIFYKARKRIRGTLCHTAFTPAPCLDDVIDAGDPVTWGKPRAEIEEALVRRQLAGALGNGRFQLFRSSRRGGYYVTFDDAKDFVFAKLALG